MKKTLVSVLSILFVSLSVMLYGCETKQDEVIVSESQTDAPTVVETGSVKYNVRFFNDNHTPLKSAEIHSGEVALPPTDGLEKPGYVFVGWDTDPVTMKKSDVALQLSDKSDSSQATTEPEVTEGTTENRIEVVEQSVEILPIYKDVREMSNVIAMPAVYVERGNSFTVPISLCGDVDFCGLDMRIHYNTEKLKLLKIQDSDPDVMTNIDGKTGTVFLNFVSAKNVTGTVDLCSLVFEPVAESRETDSLQFEIIEMVTLDDNNEFVDSEYNIVDSKIFVY